MTGWEDLKYGYDFTTTPLAIAPDSNGTYDISFTILDSTSVGTISYGGAIDYYTDPADVKWKNDFVAASSDQQDAVRTILTTCGDYTTYFSDVTNVTFTEGDNGAITIAQANNTHGLFPTGAGTETTGITIQYPGDPPSDVNIAANGDVWLNADASAGTWTDAGTAGTLGFYLIMHELGHALGLNDSSAYTQQYTIMNTLGADPDVDSSVHPTGLQLYDIAALQSIYGVNWGGARGEGGIYENTTYGIGEGFGATANKAFIYTIWDGAGTDVIDATGYSTQVEIDLRQGAFSSIGVTQDSGSTKVPWDDLVNGVDHGNVAIAYHAIIENAIGGSAGDVLIGNEWNNVLYGAAGDDTILGDGITYNNVAGYDDPNTFGPEDSEGHIPEWGPDGVAPSVNNSGNDVLIGGAGDDWLYGGLGNDILHGGYVREDIDGVRSGWDSASQFPSSSSDIAYSADGTDTADYSNLNADANVAYTGDPFSIIAIVTADGSIQVEKISNETQYFTDQLFSIEHVIGTANDDTFVMYHSLTGSPPLVLDGGAGNDTYLFQPGTSGGATGTVQIVDSAGTDMVRIDPAYTDYVKGETVTVGGVNFFDIEVSALGGGSFSPYFTVSINADDVAAGTGIEQIQAGGWYRPEFLIDYFAANSSPVMFGNLYSDTLSYMYGTTGGETVPIYDQSGNITAQEVNPSIGGSPISSSIAYAIDNPLVVTAFSQSGGGGSYSATATFDSYEKSFLFVPSIAEGDVRITASGTQGHAALTIHVDSLSYSLTISDFETGHTINGIEVYDQTLDNEILDTTSASLTSSAVNIYNAAYTAVSAMTINPSDHVSVTYFLEELSFLSGGSIDLTAPITFTGSSSNDTLTGLDSRADTVYGMAGNDTIHTYGGDDTLIGGAGNDGLYGGDGDDTYIFASGWGTDTVTESLSSGTDTIHFTGIDPADIRMYTDTVGGLHLVDTVTGDAITVTAGQTGNNTHESTIGLYVESVTFDDVNNTVWDLTGALTITGSSSGESLYGTAYNDTIYGLAGSDLIYGNAGNDTIIGGAGNDSLTGGPGDDTYVFASGWGADTVTESLSSGTDTIHFTGIDPADIRMYTDTAGALHLVDTVTGDSMTVSAGQTGNNTHESTIGLYVESVTFDDVNNTVWDLTGALTITGSSSGESLYGTAYNDTIFGLGSSDIIYGNAGNDTIIGGSGNDSLNGGPGDDTYVFASGWGSDTVNESLSSGTDVIHFTGVGPSDIRLYTDVSGYLHLVDTVTGDAMTVTAGQTGNNTHESTIGLYVESVTFDDINNTVWDLTGALTINGSSSPETLYGTAYNDTLNGMGGGDTFYGNAGNDAIYGSSGNDVIHGGPGDDILQGNGGADNLYGEAGADTFMFKAASAFSASVNIEDFSTSAGDKIDISDVISGYDPATMAITDWVQITTSGANSILKVDIDGTGSGHTWQQIATILGVTGLTDEAALVASGNLVAHA